MKSSRREFMKLAAEVPAVHTLNTHWETTGTVYWNREIGGNGWHRCVGLIPHGPNFQNAPESLPHEILDMLFPIEGCWPFDCERPYRRQRQLGPSAEQVSAVDRSGRRQMGNNSGSPSIERIDGLSWVVNQRNCFLLDISQR